MKTNKYKQVIKNLVLFTLSKFIPKTISFFLVPFYTTFLSTYEYGISDLVNTTVSFAIPILTLNIRDAVLRYTLEKNSNKNDIFSIFSFIIFLDFLILSLFTIIEFNFNIFNINPLYLIAFDMMLLVHSLYDNLTSFCKGIEKVNIIVMASITNSIFTLVFNILLIAILKYGIKGYFIANTIGYFFAIVMYFIFAKLYKHFNFKLNISKLKEMVKYSFPMIFSAIAWWINYSSDKYIITWMLGVSVSGVYAAASKLPSILTTFQNIFMEAWSISAIKEFDKNDEDGFIGNMFTIILFLLSVVCSILIIFNMLISKIMFNGEFYSAWKFVPPLLLSVLVDALALFIGNLFYAVKDTKSRAIVTIIGAVINTIFNFILIYYFGAYGAAIATLLGYVAGLIMSIILVKKYINMKTDMKKNFLIILLLLIQVIFSYFGNKFIYLQWSLLLIIILMFKKDISMIYNILKNKFISKIKLRKLGGE